jgi:hypothetical protein
VKIGPRGESQRLHELPGARASQVGQLEIQPTHEGARQAARRRLRHASAPLVEAQDPEVVQQVASANPRVRLAVVTQPDWLVLEELRAIELAHGAPKPGRRLHGGHGARDERARHERDGQTARNTAHLR